MLERSVSVNQIAVESRSQRGSIYFHSPEGKEQLAAEALRSAGAVMTANIKEPPKEMEESDFRHGCPICAGVFGEWEDLLAERLERDGFTRRST